LLEDDYRRLRAWRAKAKLSTYLVQVTRNLVIDYFALRDKGPRTERYDAVYERGGEMDVPADREIEALRMAALKDALDRLPPKQVAIIQLRLEGYTLKQIAVALRRPLGTISVENSRAVGKLRAMVRDALPPDEGTLT